MQILSIVLICISLTAYGFFLSNKIIYRLKDFKELKKALLILETEMNFGNETLSYATKNISNKIKEPLKSIFLRFSKKLKDEIYIDINILWDESIDMYKGKLYFEKEEIEEIKSLSKSFDSNDIELQLKNISILINYVDKKIEELQVRGYKEAKMYKSISVLFSLISVILLI